MIELIATTESLEQGIKLLDNGADCVVTGEEVFGLRLPGYLTDEEIGKLIKHAHAKGNKLLSRRMPFYITTKLRWRAIT